MNETLEAMARAIFKSWFVDFDPVRAKASGEPPESICRRLGLTPEVLALFPDSFQDSELGEIPKGWRVGTIADHCDLNAEWWTAKNMPDQLRYVDLANAKSGVISEVQVRNLVRITLRRYKYPPDRQEEAIRLVLDQAERLSEDWVATQAA